MDAKNITWIVSIVGWIFLAVYAVVRYKLYKQLETGPLKRLTGEVFLIEIWIIMIFLMMASDKMIFMIANY